MFKSFGLILWFISALTFVAAQTGTFEVASIKRNNSGLVVGEGAYTIGVQPGGRFVMVDGPPTALIRSAYSDAVEIIGAPAWVSSEHYDVQAKAAGVATNTEIYQMLRILLAERFKLVAHYETRERPTYALMPTRADGRLGPQLRRYDGDCAAYDDAERQGREKPPIPIPSNGATACGYRIGSGGIIAGGIDMATVARAIQFYADRRVLDKTGLRGFYEFTFEMSADVPVFTALREQLGLKLEPDRTKLPVLVVDSIERPTED